MSFEYGVKHNWFEVIPCSVLNEWRLNAATNKNKKSKQKRKTKSHNSQWMSEWEERKNTIEKRHQIITCTIHLYWYPGLTGSRLLPFSFLLINAWKAYSLDHHIVVVIAFRLSASQPHAHANIKSMGISSYLAVLVACVGSLDNHLS